MNIKSINLILFVVLFLTACSTTTSIKSDQNLETNFEYIDLLNSFCQEPSLRDPAAAEYCRDILNNSSLVSQKTTDTVFSNMLKSDPILKGEAKAYTSSQGKDSPIKISNKMQKFRNEFLGFLKNNVVREPLVKSFEAFMRMRSKISLKSLVQNNNYGQFDLVIIGSGVHGIVALHEVLKENPKLKVLVIDNGDTAGATFRYGKDVFSINSSNRASGEGTRPLPGEGNINELPNFPIQVSDLSGVKYPSANDLGVTLVTGLYAALRGYSNVEVLFNTNVKYLSDKPLDPSMNESVVIENTSLPQNIRVDAQKVIVATGLGDPILPSKVVKSLALEPKLIQSQKGKPPRVLTFEDMVRIIAESNDPMTFFKNKKIAVVGKGDSANVFIEYLLGFAPQAGYGRSSAQTGKPQRIVWIGQDKKSCEEFISDARSRYNSVSTGFKSSSPNIEALIKPYGNKLSDVAEGKKDTVNAILDGGEVISNLDYIVVATGFNPKVRELFPESAADAKNSTDIAFFDNNFKIIESSTALSEQPVKVGRKLIGRQVYIFGTAANLFVNENANKAPAKIVQNFVGIFTNAPRVAAGANLMAENLSPKATQSKLRSIEIRDTNLAQQFKITNIQETRFISNQTLPYLEATFKEALSMCRSYSGSKIALNLSLSKDGSLGVVSETKADVTEVLNLLLESRDFFALSKELLKLMPKQSLRLTADSYGLNYDLANVSLKAVGSKEDYKDTEVTELANNSIRLRGLEVAEKTLIENAVKSKNGVPEKFLKVDLMDPKSYIENAIFVTLPAGKLLESTTLKDAPVTFNKAFKIMATPVTQSFYTQLKAYLKEKQTFDINSIEVNLNLFGSKDNPLIQVSPAQADLIVEILNKLSQSDSLRDQEFMSQLIPDHVAGRIYDLPTQEQLQYAYQLAKTEDGDSINEMVKRNDIKKLSKYTNFKSNAPAEISLLDSVVSRLPQFINGQPIYLQGNVSNITKVDVLDIENRLAIGGSWKTGPLYLQSNAVTEVVQNNESRTYLGIRFVATDP